MSWATAAIAQLASGENVDVRPRGHSMSGRVEDNDLVTLTPTTPEILAKLEVGDVVLVHVQGKDYLHLIKACEGTQFLIGNNKGRINGWVESSTIYAKAVSIRHTPAT